jgi:hypothetical protein
MSQILKLAHFAQYHSMPKVNIRGRRVQTKLNLKRSAFVLRFLKFFFQRRLGHYLEGSALYCIKLLVYSHSLSPSQIMLYRNTLGGKESKMGGWFDG